MFIRGKPVFFFFFIDRGKPVCFNLSFLSASTRLFVVFLVLFLSFVIKYFIIIIIGILVLIILIELESGTFYGTPWERGRWSTSA